VPQNASLLHEVGIGPIQEATKFEMTLNLKTAKALVDVPASLLPNAEASSKQSNVC
jgi:hypothetical protein